MALHPYGLMALHPLGFAICRRAADCAESFAAGQRFSQTRKSVRHRTEVPESRRSGRDTGADLQKCIAMRHPMRSGGRVVAGILEGRRARGSRTPPVHPSRFGKLCKTDGCTRRCARLALDLERAAARFDPRENVLNFRRFDVFCGFLRRFGPSLFQHRFPVGIPNSGTRRRVVGSGRSRAFGGWVSRWPLRESPQSRSWAGRSRFRRSPRGNWAGNSPLAEVVTRIGAGGVERAEGSVKRCDFALRHSVCSRILIGSAGREQGRTRRRVA